MTISLAQSMKWKNLIEMSQVFGNPMKMSIWRLTMLILLSHSVGCDGKKKLIVITIPKDYTGPVQIYEDKVNGIPVDNASSSLIFHLDDSGRLVLASSDAFYVWHTLTFKDTQGTVVRQHDISDAHLKDNAISAFSYGTVKTAKSATRIVYYIGTKRAAKEYFRALQPSQ